MHRSHARREMSGTHAEVDQRPLFPLRIPCVDVARAHFELERGCDAVHRFEAIVLFVLAMLVKIDKAGRDSKAASIDHVAPAKCVGTYCSDYTVGNAEIANGVRSRFGIDDTAVEDHKIVDGLRARKGRNQKRANDQENRTYSQITAPFRVLRRATPSRPARRARRKPRRAC